MQSGAEVLVFEHQLVEPGSAVDAPEGRLRFFGQLQVEVQVLPPGQIELTLPLQPLNGALANRIELINQRRRFVKSVKRGAPFLEPDKRNSKAAPIKPQALMKAISDSLRGRPAHVFIDSGNCVGWSLHHLIVDPPTQHHVSLAMGPMGFGVGAVIGAKLGVQDLGQPKVPCVAIVGDGAFLMHGSEVSTAAAYGVGAVWVVLNDNDLLMASQGLDASNKGDPAWQAKPRGGRYDLGAPKLDVFAESLGAKAARVSTFAGFKQTFGRTLAATRQRSCLQILEACMNGPA